MRVFTLILGMMLISAALNAQEAEVIKVLENDTKWWTTPYKVDKLPVWHNAVGYEIFVRSFYDSNGDGIGDFKGIIQKLDYLKSLGVDYIWLMPIHPSKEYHGYDVIDYYDVNPQFGTMEDFDNLVKEAKKRGIKIILDFVYNHTSRHHPWFVDSATNEKSKYRDWYVWSKDQPLGDWPNPTGQSKQNVWNRYDFITNAYRYGWYFYSAFNFNIPDLNLENTNVVAELKKIAKFWIDKGVEGFRLDAARFAIAKGPDKQADTPETIEFWKDFMGYLKKIKPDIYVVSEVFAGPSIVEKYYQGGKTFDNAFNFEFATSFALPPLVASKSRTAMNTFNGWYNNKQIPIHFFSPFLSNHDTGRFGSKIRNDDAIKMALAMLLTTPGGLPFLYYGDEIGLPDDTKVLIGDADRRSIMLWDDTKFGGFTTGPRIWHARYNAIETNYSVKVQEQNPNSILNFTKSLITLKKTKTKALSSFADYTPLSVSKDVIMAYARKYENDYAIVIYNLSKRDENTVSLELNGLPTGISYVDGLSSLGSDVKQIGETIAKDKKTEIKIKPREVIVMLFSQPTQQKK
ncbi:MAG: alpha-amylase family glycosyl hydrolase [Spirochaetia bacterium]|nr:alpha-amylase family glycosyl hydrolase [Spirochaetota bacterium]MDW8112896.1 alpha-amylase family glycosyl hydrolase [Spirochaetia bacterium]